MKKKLLFLCTGNSCRSQMAEAFAKKYLSDEYDVFSAGIKKSQVNQYAIQTMLEKNIDISGYSSKTINELTEKRMHWVVTLCSHAQDSCPIFPGGKLSQHAFDDPPSLTKNLRAEEEILAVYRRVRDQIENLIIQFKNKSIGDSFESF